MSTRHLSLIIPFLSSLVFAADSVSISGGSVGISGTVQVDGTVALNTGTIDKIGEKVEKSSQNMISSVFGNGYYQTKPDGTTEWVPTASMQATIDALKDDPDNRKTYAQQVIDEQQKQIAAQDTTTTKVGDLNDSVGMLFGTESDGTFKAGQVTKTLTTNIVGVEDQVLVEGDQTQNTIITMVGRTNKLLKHFMTLMPEMVRIGIYNNRDLNAANLEAIKITLPDISADMTLTQNNMVASINPLDPTNNPAPLSYVNKTAQQKIINAFAGTSKLPQPLGQASNRMIYSAQLLSKSLYPVVKGRKPSSAETKSNDDDLFYLVGAENSIYPHIYTHFLKPAEPKDNYEHLSGRDQAFIAKFFTEAPKSSEHLKAGKYFMLFKGLQARMSECEMNFQPDPSAKKKKKSDSDEKVSYSVYPVEALKGKSKKEEIEKMNCGPIILGGTSNLRANKYGNGWGTIVHDLKLIWEEKDGWEGTAAKIAEGSYEDISPDSLYIDCSKNGRLDDVCKSLNSSIAKLWIRTNNNFFKKEGKVQEISGVKQTAGEKPKAQPQKMKDILSAFAADLQMSGEGLYAYLYTELNDFLSREAASSTALANQKELSNFPSYDHYFNPQTYYEKSGGRTHKKNPIVLRAIPEKMSSDPTGINATNMMSCTSQEATFGPPELISNTATKNVYQFLSHIAGLSSSPSLDIAQLPIPRDYSENDKQYQVVLSAGGFMQLVQDKKDEKTKDRFFNKTKDAKFLILATKKGDATKTMNKRPQFLSQLQISQQSDLARLESIMMSKSSALSNLLFGYDQRANKYTYKCTARISPESNSTSTKTVQMTPMEGMIHNTRWRLTNKKWRTNVQSMDQANLARQQLYLMSEMYEMQFQQYVLLERIMNLISIQVGQGATQAEDMIGLTGGNAKNAVDSYVKGRIQVNMGGAAGAAAAEATNNAKAQEEQIASANPVSAESANSAAQSAS